MRLRRSINKLSGEKLINGPNRLECYVTLGQNGLPGTSTTMKETEKEGNREEKQRNRDKVKEREGKRRKERKRDKKEKER